MRKINKNLVYCLFAVTMAIGLYSCTKDSDNLNEWGNPWIYMPQAAVLNGGSTNVFPVPNTGPSKNFVLDTIENSIKIILGVTRSGLQKFEPYTVDVAADIHSTDSIISSNSVSNGIKLSSEVFSLPENVSVPAGSNGNSFYLTIDRKKLLDLYGSFYGKKFVLVVRISNPTAYELNPKLSQTIVVIDSKQFMGPPPAVNLVKGGDMEAASKQHWTWTNDIQVWGYSDDRPAGGTAGCLKWFDASTLPNPPDNYIFQAVQVEKDSKYQLSALVKVPAGSSNFWLNFQVSDVAPFAAGWDKNVVGNFLGIYYSGATALLNGDIRVVGNQGWGNHGSGLANGGTNGVFTATSATIYIIINFGFSGSLGGPVLFDEVKLVKVN
jgi:hypothetical protein